MFRRLGCSGVYVVDARVSFCEDLAGSVLRTSCSLLAKSRREPEHNSSVLLSQKVEATSPGARPVEGGWGRRKIRRTFLLVKVTISDGRHLMSGRKLGLRHPS